MSRVDALSRLSKAASWASIPISSSSPSLAYCPSVRLCQQKNREGQVMDMKRVHT